jgi:hypothetical protein
MVTMKDNIIDYCNNPYKVPMFTHKEWHDIRARNTHPDDQHTGSVWFMEQVKDYVSNHKPLLPIKRPTINEMSDSFNKLLNSNSKSNLKKNLDPTTVRNKFDEKVEVKYAMSCGHNFNDVSNHFHCDNRYTCGHATAASSQYAWDNPYSSRFHSMMLYLFREFKGETSPIDEQKYRAMFRLSGYVATQFKPSVAKTIYETEGARKVIDISCGWGDRLAGFYTSNNTSEYLGCDPNTESYELYKKQCVAYEELLQSPLFPVETTFTDHGDWFEVTGSKRVRIYNKPAEDMDWDNICDGQYDLMFTSPPYFGIEKYAEGSASEDDQSWKRYNQYDQWRDTFFYPVMDAMKKHCKKVMINIVDPVVNGKRNYIEKDIIDRYGIDYVVGMMISKRPNSSDMSDHYRVEDDKKLNFIEPIYVIKP